MNKTGLNILLLISAGFVLYPQISTLIDILNLLSRYGSISQEVLATRDTAIIYVIGYILLYVFLFFLLNANFENQQSQPANPFPEKLPTHQESQALPLSKDERTWIILISGLVFLAFYFWQFIPPIMEGSTQPFIAAMASLPISIIATIIAGTASYYFFKRIV
jgi:hypothetical protein